MTEAPRNTSKEAPITKSEYSIHSRRVLSEGDPVHEATIPEARDFNNRVIETVKDMYNTDLDTSELSDFVRDLANTSRGLAKDGASPEKQQQLFNQETPVALEKHGMNAIYLLRFLGLDLTNNGRVNFSDSKQE